MKLSSNCLNKEIKYLAEIQINNIEITFRMYRNEININKINKKFQGFLL